MTVTFTLCLVLISLFLTYLERSETLWSQSKLLTTKLRDHFSHSLVCLLWRISSSPLTSGCRYRSVNSSCAQPPSPLPPRLLWSICPPCQSWGWDICKLCVLPRGRALANPGANPKLLTHTVSYQHITTQWILLEKQADWLICQGQKNWRGLEMYVLDFMHAFLHCWSSQNYIAKWGSIDKNQRFLVIESNFCWYYLKNILSYL